MVAFCKKCGVSLPLADVVIKNGEEMPSPDYHCPACGLLASEKSASGETTEKQKS